MSGSGSDDGLLQRFGMMVWPDMPRTWTEHDREPNSEFRQQALDAFDYLDDMTPDRIGAAFDPYDKGGAYLRFDDAGFELFREWRAGLEHRLRSGELHPAVESHLAKYRKLEIGRASCRERVCQYVWISVVAGSFKKKN